MKRRDFVFGAAAAALSGCAHRIKTPAVYQPLPSDSARLELVPVMAEVDRIVRVTVCLRPFRAAGPRLDVERVGDKTVVHNYGHGGSGWSLSWGSSSIAADKALSTGERDIAVIGCGALGLTSAILLQRAGARVTIYAKERPPEVRSARATGSWSPDSRIALSNAVSPDFPALWERMCRSSFSMYQSYVGLAGNPVEWTDWYTLPDDHRGFRTDQGPSFASYEDRVTDLRPPRYELAPGSHPFPAKHAFRSTSLTFNIAAYSRQLVNDFLVEGGRIERVEFHSPSELTELRQNVVVNATGYGARALWKDESIVPVRGQIAWLIPQPDVRYGVFCRNLLILARRDGIVVQDLGKGDIEGYGDSNEEPNRAAAESAVREAGELFRAMRRSS